MPSPPTSRGGESRPSGPCVSLDALALVVSTNTTQRSLDQRRKWFVDGRMNIHVCDCRRPIEAFSAPIRCPLSAWCALRTLRASFERRMLSHWRLFSLKPTSDALVSYLALRFLLANTFSFRTFVKLNLYLASSITGATCPLRSKNRGVVRCQDGEVNCRRQVRQVVTRQIA